MLSSGASACRQQVKRSEQREAKAWHRSTIPKVESEPTDSHVAKRFPTDATTHFGMNEAHLEVFDTNTYMGLDTNITRSQPGHIQVTTRSQPGHIQVMRIPNQN